jgi:predicted phage terminase large subunit-like protein
MAKLSKELMEIREVCENSLKAYADWMFPDRYFGEVHYDLFDFFQYDPHRCKLALIPRDHQKSFCMAVTVTWLITVNPAITINYISANEDLVLAQMNTIQHILTHERHRMLWPEMLNWVKGRSGALEHKPKGRWQQKLIEVDHPLRYEKAVRDPTVRMSTVKSGNTGMHSDVTVFDDIVTDENYASEADRRDVLNCYKNFAKISTTGSKFFAVGTRYGMDDVYAKMMELEYTYLDEEGNEVREKRWAVFERVVEDSPNRTGDGNFLWPRMKMTDGSEYGFDQKELAIKKADLLIDGDITSFYAQYYNDPNDASLHKVSKDCFQYMDQRLLKKEAQTWFYKDKPLKIYAAADLAFSEGGGIKKVNRRDYTAVAVVGVDADGYIYVLDLDRFQTSQPEVYFERIIDLHEHWGFDSIVVETNNAGAFIKRYLEDEARRRGSRLTVIGKAHVSHQGKKEERISQVLDHRYRNGHIFHNRVSLIRELELEIMLPRPAHDDLKDALAMAVAEARPPRGTGMVRKVSNGTVVPMSRFGGSRRRRR